MKYSVNTAVDRLKFYKALLKKVCNDPSITSGFCYYITKMSSNKFDISDLPELCSIKPAHKDLCVYWFPNTKKGWETRICKLVEVIDRMEKGDLKDYYKFEYPSHINATNYPFYVPRGHHTPENLIRRCLTVSPGYELEVKKYMGRTILTFIKK